MKYRYDLELADEVLGTSWRYLQGCELMRKLQVKTSMDEGTDSEGWSYPFNPHKQVTKYSEMHWNDLSLRKLSFSGSNGRGSDGTIRSNLILKRTLTRDENKWLLFRGAGSGASVEWGLWGSRKDDR